jgi:hypothetical protein
MTVSFLFLSQEDVIECGGLDARRCVRSADEKALWIPLNRESSSTVN